MHQLTLNTLLSLIIQSKITGKGRIGNGRIFIRLLSVIADCPNPNANKEWNMLALFSSHADKQSAYRQINRILLDFVPTGTGCSMSRITIKTFEKRVGIGKKFSMEQYRLYLAEMGSFCSEILDKEKAPALVNTLLELLRKEDEIQYILYGFQLIHKNHLSRTAAHPKKICLEALLLGLLYQTLKNFTPADAGAVQLSDSESDSVRVLWLGNKENPIFWGESSELLEILNPELKISVKESLQTRPVPENDFCYPVEIQYHNKIILLNPLLFDEINQNYLFLYASGGMGKSFLLQHQNGLLLSLSGYREEFREKINPACSCWILIQILLKYHYHFAYPTFDICIACEGEETLLQQISELLNLLKKQPENQLPEYTLLLDGMNEMNPELHDIFTEELAYICQEWYNIRIIITSRNVPVYEVFDDFEKIEILGIPENSRDSLLSEYPETMKNAKLLEILRTPLFLKYFLESQNSPDMLSTRGEILDAYFSNQLKKYEKPLQFVIKYALPFLAYSMQLFHLNIRRSDVSDAVEKAFSIYLDNEHIYQNLLAEEKFRKQALRQTRNSIDFTELLIEKTGILVIKDNQLQFSHQYIHHYFMAKYILNAVHAVKADYRKQIFDNFQLEKIWYDWLDSPYLLIGEICGDYRNIPDKNGIFEYHRTELDALLDMARDFHADSITNEIIKVMRFSRNHLICGVDFSSLFISVFNTSGLKFSDNGSYPSDFHKCRIHTLPNRASFIFCADFSSDGKKILLGMDDSHVILFDFRAGRILKDYNLHSCLNYGECFENIRFLNHDKEFIVTTQYTSFLTETDTGKILSICPEKNPFSYSGRAAAVSQDYQHFLINDIIYSVTGERRKIQFPERYNHFRNCDFRGFVSFLGDEKNKEILRKSGALIE